MANIYQVFFLCQNLPNENRMSSGMSKLDRSGSWANHLWDYHRIRLCSGRCCSRQWRLSHLKVLFLPCHRSQSCSSSFKSYGTDLDRKTDSKLSKLPGLAKVFHRFRLCLLRSLYLGRLRLRMLNRQNRSWNSHWFRIIQIQSDLCTATMKLRLFLIMRIVMYRLINLEIKHYNLLLAVRYY